MSTTKKTDKPADDLPRLVEASDLKYPEYDRYDNNGRVKTPGDNLTRELQEKHDLPEGLHDRLVIYKCSSAGKGTQWCIATLWISTPSRRGRASGGGSATARTYAVGVDDGKVYTIGSGPHVEKVVTVYLKASNVERLLPLIKLWRQGMADAGAIRDRISSRRAQGQLYRGQGRSSWYW